MIVSPMLGVIRYKNASSPGAFRQAGIGVWGRTFREVRPFGARCVASFGLTLIFAQAKWFIVASLSLPFPYGVLYC